MIRAGPDRLGLNDQQAEALSRLRKGPLRVVAGPGTGKTTTVVGMYLQLLEDGLRPSEILLLTFATNAAAELKARIDSEYRSSYDESWVSTFHSFAMRVLTKYGLQRGIQPFQLMNGFEEKVLMRHVLGSLPDGLVVLEPLRSSDALAQDALWLIGILKQNLVRADTFAQLAAESGTAKVRDLAAIYRAYWAEQDRLRLWDFRDVIAQCWLLLEHDDDLCRLLSAKFRHVIVDEYQDVDAAQVKLISQVVSGHSPHPRLAVVGDPNQSIYSFRGTLPAYLEDVWQFGGERIELKDNYRSVGQVVSASDRLLARYGLAPAGLIPKRGDSDVPVLVLDREQNSVDEATAVARTIQGLLQPGPDGRPAYRPGDVAIVLRSVRRSGRPFEEALRAAGIPHETGASPNFAASEVVRFGFAALTALSHPEDDAQLAEVLESPFAGVPTADARRLLEEAQRRQQVQPDALSRKSLLTVLKHTCFLLLEENPERWPLPWAPEQAGDSSDPIDSDPEPVLPGEASRAELERQGQIADAREDAEAREGHPHRPKNLFFQRLTPEGRDAVHVFTWRWSRLQGLVGRISTEALAYRVFQDLGTWDLIMDPGLGEDRRAELLGPLRMFLRAVADYSEFQRTLQAGELQLADLLPALQQALPEYIDELAAPADAEQGVVRILTVHASKGLEFPVVFMPAMAAQRFPVVERARTPLLSDDERAWFVRRLPDFQPPWPKDAEDFLKEETRLGYVAATRAKDMVFLSWADEYEKQEPTAPSAFLEPLVGAAIDEAAIAAAGAVLNQYGELRRSPALRESHGGAPADLAEFLGWEPWSRRLVLDGGGHDSASSISTYLACPRKYYYSKSLGLSSGSGIAAARGTAFHDALAEFHAPEVEEQWRQDPDAAYRLFNERRDAAIAAHLAKVGGKLEKEFERKALRTLFDNYFQSEFDPSRPWPNRTLATERCFDWHPLDDVTVMGYIDRILVLDGEGHEIADYKTGAGANKSDIEKELGLSDAAATNFQMLIYYFGSREGVVEGLSDLNPHVVGLWYPRDVMKRPPGIRKTRIVMGDDAGVYPPANTIVLDEDRVASLRDSIVGMLKEIRAGSFPPLPRHDGYTCLSTWGNGCDYVWVCPGRIEEPESYEAE